MGRIGNAWGLSNRPTREGWDGAEQSPPSTKAHIDTVYDDAIYSIPMSSTSMRWRPGKMVPQGAGLPRKQVD